MNQSPESRWRLERSISVGDLLVFLSLLGAGVGYVVHQDQRATRTETKVEGLESTDQRHDREMKEFREDTGQKLDRLDNKLDRLLERSSTGRR